MVTYTLTKTLIFGYMLLQKLNLLDKITVENFPSMLKQQTPLCVDKEYVLYDVLYESLFTNISVNETISYIINEIYQKNKLPQICSKTIFNRLLYKLTTEVSFQFNYSFLKQTNGCTMDGPLSVTLADIHMIRMETDIVVPIRPMFYKRYVDDIYNRCQKNTVDKLYDGLNNYHPKVKITIETNPLRFLDTEIIHNNGMMETRVHWKKTKLPTPWASNIPKRYKWNTITAELYRAKCISSNFTKMVTLIRNKFKSAGYPMRFVNSVLLIMFDVQIKWLTKKVKTLFKVKDKSLHQACKIYKGIYQCPA